ncbi:MAG TPA: UvrD-helicase domain-containing protein, partial [Chthonomonadaceae bacterium]|nr:UvrD-helicase domain-containing protein [Chthonomonadaceae bacterium]
MPDWSALRRRAYQHHLRLRAQLSGDPEILPPADQILDAAAAETGMRRTPVPPDDPLLSEAHAVLDREAARIFYARGRGVSAARQRLAQAHEFAHYWLHGDLDWDACQAEDIPTLFMPPSARAQSAQVAEGYSPRQRQETEANIFAAELLLPRPVLFRLFTQEGWNATRIAAQAGLSESCVLAQMVEALLLPLRPEAFLSEDDVAQAESLSGAELDLSQREAAHIAAGPVLVDAGPGTGKTRTLVARILYLLREQNVAPDNILAVTFTNKAAEEMRTRLRGVVGAAADRVWIGTFHAFGYELLRRDGHRLGLPPAPPLIEPADAVALLEHHLDRLQLEEFEYLSQPALPFMDILGCISRAKDELKTPEHYFE